jgi:hypothetical protein
MVHAHEIHASEIRAREIHARKTHAHEMHAHETHAYEIYDCEPPRIGLSMLLLNWTHFGFRIGAGKVTAVLAFKSVDEGALKHTSDHLGCPEGTIVRSRVTPAGGEH